MSNREKISRLNSIQEVFLNRQHPARQENGERIVPSKPFRHRVYVSVFGVRN